MIQESKGRVNKILGRARSELGRRISNMQGTSFGGAVTGVLAFAVTALSVSLLLFPSFREGIGRRTGVYQPKSPVDRYTGGLRDLGHRLGIPR